jgi:outer membrane protein OmpA-like peptidoglycan-associated protein
MLNPPETVRLSFADGILEAKGSATHRWIAYSRGIGPLAPGVELYDDKSLKNVDLETRGLLKARIESARVDFDPDRIEPVGGQSDLLDTIADNIRRFVQVSDLTENPSRVEIVGRSDGSGDEENNVLLSRQRAENLRSRFISRGLPGDVLSATGVGSADPLSEKELTDRDKKINRRATFRIVSSK